MSTLELYQGARLLKHCRPVGSCALIYLVEDILLALKVIEGAPVVLQD